MAVGAESDVTGVPRTYELTSIESAPLTAPDSVVAVNDGEAYELTGAPSC